MRIPISLLTLLILAAPALGQATGGTKIGVVDSTAILQGTAEGRQALAGLEQFVNQTQSDLAARQTELDTLRREYDSKYRMLNPDTLTEMQRAIAEKERQLTRAREDVEAVVTERQNELLAKMSEKIQTVIAEYAEQNGFGAVFLDSPGIPFIAQKLDITEAVIKAYDAKYPVAGAAAAASPQP